MAALSFLKKGVNKLPVFVSILALPKNNLPSQKDTLIQLVVWVKVWAGAGGRKEEFRKTPAHGVSSSLITPSAYKSSLPEKLFTLIHNARPNGKLQQVCTNQSPTDIEK